MRLPTMTTRIAKQGSIGAETGAETEPRAFGPLDPARHVGAVLDGRFRLVKMLGAGAMGAIYVGVSNSGDRYAIKLLLHEQYSRDPLLIRRFVREGRLTTGLDVPHIARVYEFAVDKATGTPFIVMELLEGYDVEELISRVGGPIDPTTAVRIILQAANGLIAAHSANIVHRDVKPANIFLHHQPGSFRSLRVKICDFGIAKALANANDAITVSGAIVGSPLYMSPEQIHSSKHVDARSDVWSLGMALWTMLAGKPAFDHIRSMPALLVAISTKSIPWLQDTAPWIDPALARIVHGTLLRDLPERCPDMETLIEALQPFAGDNVELIEDDLVGTPESMQQKTAERGLTVRSWTDCVPTAAPLTDSDPSLQALIGETIASRYRVERLLGSGGMGAVYEACDKASKVNDRVAIKMILQNTDRQRPEVLRRFVREAKASMAVNSPHVVRVLDAGVDYQKMAPFIVMELLKGTDLNKLVKRSGALESAAVVKAFHQACLGLAAVHARGIVHRDIKPANVFLHEMGNGRLQVKICDFGVAKREQSEHTTTITRSGGMLGSPMYMSPEQAQNAKNVDFTSDVWSLGIALYEALSGKRAWEGKTVGNVIVAICTQEVPPLQDVAPWIEPELANAVHRALQRDPAARYRSMDAFAAALVPFAGSPGELLATSLVPVSQAHRAIVSARSSFGLTTTVRREKPIVQPVTKPAPKKNYRSAGMLAALAISSVAIGTILMRQRPNTMEEAHAIVPATTAPSKEQILPIATEIAVKAVPSTPISTEMPTTPEKPIQARAGLGRKTTPSASPTMSTPIRASKF